MLAGFPPASLTVIAGKANAGRSASIQLPASPDSVTLDLVLAATSGLEGKVTRNGQPLGDTVIIANPIGAMWSNFFVTTGPDGTFALDALAPGSYVVYPMLGGGGNGPKDDVPASRRGRARQDDDDRDRRDARSSDARRLGQDGQAGAPLPMAGLIAIQLSINPQTAEELRDGTLIPSGDQIIPMNMRGIRAGATTIEGMRPGAHTLCAALGDPRVVSSLKIKCTQVTLTRSREPDRVDRRARGVGGGPAVERM